MTEQQQSSVGLNQVTIVGRAGKDPELKYFESGTVKASFSLAVDRPTSKENRETDWFNIEVWARPAEIVGEYLKKGREAAVSGRLSVRKYNDEAGNEREYLSVTASEVRFVGGRRDSESAGGYATPPQQQSNMQQAPF